LKNIENDLGYNFFINNCSSELLELLSESNKVDVLYGFKTPSKVIQILCNNDMIEYAGTYSIKTINKKFTTVEVDNSKIDITRRNYYTKLSIYSDADIFRAAFTLFDTNRPIDGIAFQKNKLEIVDSAIEVNSLETKLQFRPVSLELRPVLVSPLGLLFGISSEYYDGWSFNYAIGTHIHFKNFRYEMFYTDIYLENLQYKSVLSNRSFDLTIKGSFSTNPYIENIKLTLLTGDRIRFNIDALIKIDTIGVGIGMEYHF
jgi:hypothetical protein